MTFPFQDTLQEKLKRPDVTVVKKKCCLFDIARLIENHFRPLATESDTQFSISFLPSSEPHEICVEVLMSELEKKLSPAFKLSRHGMVELKLRIQADQNCPVLHYQICDSRQAGMLEKTIRFLRGQSWVDWLELFGTRFQGEIHLNVIPLKLTG